MRHIMSRLLRRDDYHRMGMICLLRLLCLLCSLSRVKGSGTCILAILVVLVRHVSYPRSRTFIAR